MEIPADYIIEDDLWQAKISFHGTHAWSPDSTILVSFYAGFQCLDKEEFTESILESLEEDGFFVRVACLGLADEVHDHPAIYIPRMNNGKQLTRQEKQDLIDRMASEVFTILDGHFLL